jgi:hypothetical protein
MAEDNWASKTFETSESKIQDAPHSELKNHGYFYIFQWPLELGQPPWFYKPGETKMYYKENHFYEGPESVTILEIDDIFDKDVDEAPRVIYYPPFDMEKFEYLVSSSHDWRAEEYKKKVAHFRSQISPSFDLGCVWLRQRGLF